jgi:hypothetical protein
MGFKVIKQIYLTREKEAIRMDVMVREPKPTLYQKWE